MNRRELLSLAAAMPALAADNWKPAFFDEHQNATVIALADLIIPATDTPGAKAALVNRHLDHLLAAGPAAEQERFLSILSRLDAYAIRTAGKSFVSCSPEIQSGILTAPESERLLRSAKSMIATIYYATESGFKELNRGGRVPATFACKHEQHQ